MIPDFVAELLDLMEDLKAQPKCRENDQMLAHLNSVVELYWAKQKRLSREGAKLDVDNGPELKESKEEDSMSASSTVLPEELLPPSAPPVTLPPGSGEEVGPVVDGDSEPVAKAEPKPKSKKEKASA